MENRMARPAQTSGDNHLSLSGSERPPSPAPLQEQPTMLSEQQRFKRITIWTLLLGIMIGCWLTLVGIMVYNFQLNPADLVINLIGTSFMIPGGVALILLGKIRSLRRQHPASRADRFADRFNDSSLLSYFMGLLWIWVGSSPLIERWFNLDFMISYLIAGLLICAATLVAKLFFSFLSKHYTLQQ